MKYQHVSHKTVRHQIIDPYTLQSTLRNSWHINIFMFIKIQCLKLEVQCSIKRYPKPQAPRLQPQTPLAKPQAPNPKHKTPSPCSKKLINLLMNQQFLNTPIHDAKSLIHALFETIHKTKEISFFVLAKGRSRSQMPGKDDVQPTSNRMLGTTTHT